MKYKEWLEDWINYYVKQGAKPRTVNMYTQQINKYIIPKLGDFELNELTALELQKFTVDLSDTGLSANTVNGIINILKKSLSDALSVGIVDKQYSNFIKRPKIKERQIECFTQEEQRKIEKYISEQNNQKLNGIILCLYTGLRIGELLSLEWSDIDLQRQTITISKTCQDSWKNGTYIKLLDTPKTECSERIIPFPKQLKPMLKGMKKTALCNFVVPGKTKYGAQIRSYQRTFTNLLSKLDIEHKGFHSLRHTFATRALECGMDIKTLSTILGHKNPTVTLKRYTHSLLEHKTEMMNKIGKMLYK